MTAVYEHHDKSSNHGDSSTVSCTACLAAESAPRSADFTPGCNSCLARALAATGAHEESAHVGSMTTSYRAALVALFGDEWAAGHTLVKTWGARVRLIK